MPHSNGMIFDIEHGSFVDGPGIRTTVFFKGCNLRCKWCHNPESQEKYPQKLFYKDKCIDCGMCKAVCKNPDKCILCGECVKVCPRGAISICGRTVTSDEVMSEILKDKDFYGTDGGVTFSGGECMLQIDFLLELLKKCKQNDIHTAVDTAGNVPFEYFERILPYTDLFLYDIKLADSKKHKEYTGADNQLIIENLKKLSDLGQKIIVRIPIIGGVNDNTEEYTVIRVILKDINTVGIEVLPYHKMGENKFRALGLNPIPFETPSKERIEEIKHLFSQR